MTDPRTVPPRGETVDPEVDASFRLPAHIASNPELVNLHRQWIADLRAESSGLPMHTVQSFLLERIATMYVVMRHEELADRTDRSEWTPRLFKEYTDQWLNMVKEWNKVLSSGHEQLREQVLRESEKIATEALALIEDDETRRRVRLHFKERYAAIGL